MKILVAEMDIKRRGWVGCKGHKLKINGKVYVETVDKLLAVKFVFETTAKVLRVINNFLSKEDQLFRLGDEFIRRKKGYFSVICYAQLTPTSGLNDKPSAIGSVQVLRTFGKVKGVKLIEETFERLVNDTILEAL